MVQRVIELEARYMREVMRQERYALAKSEITEPQFWTLDILHEKGPCPVGLVCDALNSKPSSVTSMVDRLVELDLVHRERSEKDRRVVLLSLTSKGKTLLHETRKQQAKTIKEVFAHLTEKEREQYLALIEKMAEYLPDF
jgi:DNA-binding MarR family transcriptional regulator